MVGLFHVYPESSPHRQEREEVPHLQTHRVGEDRTGAEAEDAPQPGDRLCRSGREVERPRQSHRRDRHRPEQGLPLRGRHRGARRQVRPGGRRLSRGRREGTIRSRLRAGRCGHDRPRACPFGGTGARGLRDDEDIGPARSFYFSRLQQARFRGGTRGHRGPARRSLFGRGRPTCGFRLRPPWGIFWRPISAISPRTGSTRSRIWCFSTRRRSRII
jgi:hypothetical protein